MISLENKLSEILFFRWDNVLLNREKNHQPFYPTTSKNKRKGLNSTTPMFLANRNQRNNAHMYD